MKSTTVEVIKVTRGTAKGKVSCFEKALDNMLIPKLETFLLDNIYHNRADMLYDQLNHNNEEFDKLYKRYHKYTEIDASSGALVKEF